MGVAGPRLSPEVEQQAKHDPVQRQVEQRRVPYMAVGAGTLQQRVQAAVDQIGQHHQPEQGRDEHSVETEFTGHR
ncbi:hypothetical protein G6F57_022842 [Rhizopus arrhizus]|nr:hypothetical protein G6F57_022842 [Rhizopus arrhizus]